MQKADMPTTRAQEPNEEACQPMIEDMATEENTSTSHQCNVISSSQNTGSQPSQALSCPAPGLSPMARALWLQKRRTIGLWVQCDKCDKWRFIHNIIDRYELPKSWNCNMNPDQAVAECSVPEVPIKVRDDEDLIYSEYSAGSLVWARLGDWPWWPAMVDDCPDTEQFYWLDGFSDIPTHYNVVFFDSAEVTRAWLRPNQLKSYSANKRSLKNVSRKNKDFRMRIDAAIKQADHAESLPLSNRLSKYSFIARYKGKLVKPKKISKFVLKKKYTAMQKRLNTEFSEESDSENESESSPKKETIIRKNVMIFGTPKKAAAKKVINACSENASDEKISELNELVNAKTSDSQTTNMMTENNNNESQYDSIHHNSLTVHIDDSLNPSAIDNDSSKTYVPDTETAAVTENMTQDIQIRVETPCSDDFDF